MMIHGYDKSYLPDAMDILGEMLDYAGNDCGIDINRFFELFIISGLGRAFEKGEPRVVAGMSGCELAREVFLKTGCQAVLPELSIRMERSPEYWCGWILAYAQWMTGRDFRRIINIIPIDEIKELYPVLHEAPEEKFVEILQKRTKAQQMPARLQMLRKTAGLTQSELAKRSQVSLRSIQLYEQRQKDINKAQVTTVRQLATVLGCQMEELLEDD